MAGRYDRNPFAEEEEEVNPFAVSFSLFRFFDFTGENSGVISLKASFFELGFANLVYSDLVNLT